MDRRELSGYMRASQGENAMDLNIKEGKDDADAKQFFGQDMAEETALCSSPGVTAKAELAERLAAAIARANPMRIQPSEIAAMTKRQMCKHLSLSKYGLLLLDRHVPAVAFPTDRAALHTKHRVPYLYDQVARSDVFVTRAERTLSKAEYKAERAALQETKQHGKRKSASQTAIQNWTAAYRPSASPVSQA
jgi:hypothetical protein